MKFERFLILSVIFILSYTMVLSGCKPPKKQLKKQGEQALATEEQTDKTPLATKDPKKTEVQKTPAEDQKAQAKAKAKSERINNPFLWEIKGPNGRVYILGTVHVGVDARKAFSDEVWSRFKRSKKFVIETDLNKAQMGIIARAPLPKGKSLKTMMGDDDWGKLNKIMGGGAAQFEHMQPWFVHSLLVLKMLPADVNPLNGMEMVFLEESRKAKMGFGYLEEPEVQFKVLEKTMNLEELKEAVNEFDKRKDQLKKTIDAYKTGDAENAHKLLSEDEKGKEAQFEELIYNRNEAWIPKIEGFIKEGRVFIAFGSGHLFGKRGVLALLKERGYKIERVKVDSK